MMKQDNNNSTPPTPSPSSEEKSNPLPSVHTAVPLGQVEEESSKKSLQPDEKDEDETGIDETQTQTRLHHAELAAKVVMVVAALMYIVTFTTMMVMSPYGRHRTVAVITTERLRTYYDDEADDDELFPPSLYDHHHDGNQHHHHNGNVVSLTENDFDDFLAENENVFVNFYVPWCSWSLRFLPTWNALADRLERLSRHSNNHVRVAQVNCMEQAALCRHQTIFSFPTIRWLSSRNSNSKKNDKDDDDDVIIIKDYSSIPGADRSVDGLYVFALEQLAAAAETDGSLEDPMAGTTSSSNSKETVPALAIVDNDNDDDDDDGVNDSYFDSNVLEQQGTAFIVFESSSSSCPLCRALSHTWKEQDEMNAKDGLPARVYRVDCADHPALCRNHGIMNLPTLRWYNHGKLEIEIPEYQKSFLQGQQDVSSKQDDVMMTSPAVTKLTDDSFDDFLADNDHVFVLFYVPWCVWCQRLLPTWSDFAEQLEKEGMGDVKVVKVDCVAQSDICRRQKVYAYPTMRWSENGNFIVPDYQMHRTVESLMEYTTRQLARSMEFGSPAGNDVQAE